MIYEEFVNWKNRTAPQIVEKTVDSMHGVRLAGVVLATDDSKITQGKNSLFYHAQVLNFNPHLRTRL
jgi:hypothetical protein